MCNKTYRLVMDKWANGGEQGKDLYGEVRMLNEDGFSCCLGQFAAQRGVPEHLLLEKGTPVCVRVIYGNYDTNFLDADSYRHSELAVDLMKINDENPEITNIERAEKIKDRMAKDGLKLMISHSNY